MMQSALYQSAWISTGLPRRGVTTQSPTLASIHVSCTPVSEPMVASNDGLLVTAGDDELVGCHHQRLHKFILDGRAQRIRATRRFSVPVLNGCCCGALFGGRDDRCLTLQAYIEAKNAGIKQIFAKIEPTLTLGIVLEVAIPMACGFHLCCIIRKIERR